MRQSTVAMATVVLDLQLGDDLRAGHEAQLHRPWPWPRSSARPSAGPALGVEGLDLQLVTIYAGHEARMRPPAGRARSGPQLWRER